MFSNLFFTFCVFSSETFSVELEYICLFFNHPLVNTDADSINE